MHIMIKLNKSYYYIYNYIDIYNDTVIYELLYTYITIQLYTSYYIHI